MTEFVMWDIEWRKEAWIDVVNLLFAAFLFASPWIYGFASVPATARDAWICGIMIGLASIRAILAYSEWEEWVSVLFGLWVLISPWALDFHHTVAPAMRVDVVVGIVVIMLAAVRMWSMRLPHVHA
jgi:hypothetical protein